MAKTPDLVKNESVQRTASKFIVKGFMENGTFKTPMENVGVLEALNSEILKMRDTMVKMRGRHRRDGYQLLMNTNEDGSIALTSNMSKKMFEPFKERIADAVFEHRGMAPVMSDIQNTTVKKLQLDNIDAKLKAELFMTAGRTDNATKMRGMALRLAGGGATLYSTGRNAFRPRIDKAIEAQEKRDVVKNDLQAQIDTLMNTGVKKQAARLDWAKRHKDTPLGKSILKAERRKSAGGRMLDKASRSIHKVAIGAALTAITATVTAAVKFLSALPQIASNVHKLATKGAQYNVDNATLDRYKTMSRKLGLDEDGSSFTRFLGGVHAKLGSIMSGDIDGSINKMAALDALVNGRTVDESVKYFTGKSSNPIGVSNAVTNTVMKAAFTGTKVVNGRIVKTSINDAFSSAVLDAEATYSGSGELLSRMFEYWQTITDENKKKEIMERTIAGENFVDLMENYMTQGGSHTITGRTVAGATGAERGLEVKKSFDDLNATYQSIKDGVLLQILSFMEPIANYLRQLLKSVLVFLNDKFPKLGLQSTITALDAEDRAFNVETEKVNNAQMQVTRIVLDKQLKQYGVTEAQALQALGDYTKRGVVLPGIPKDQIENFYGTVAQWKVQTDTKEALKEQAEEEHPMRVSASPNSYANISGGQLHAGAYRRGEAIEQVYDKFGIGSGTLEADKQKLEQAVTAMEKTLKNLDISKLLASNIMGEYLGGDTATGATVRDPTTGVVYANILEHKQGLLDWINYTKSAIAELSSVMDDGKYEKGEVKTSLAQQAERETAQIAVGAQQIDVIRESGFFSEYLNGLANNTLRVVGEIKAEQREYTFRILDAYGKELFKAKDVYNPVMGTRMHLDKESNFNFDVQAYAESGESM